MHLVRTTVDLPEAVLRRARELAAQSNRSVSAVVAELTTRGLATLDESVPLTADPVSGLPTWSVGRRVTSQDVAAALHDE